MKSIPQILWIVPSAILLIATAHLPYEYYVFTRFVTGGAAVWIVALTCQEKPITPVAQVWIIVFAGLAILFNPFVPLRLTRGTWFYLDLGAAAVFLAHLLLVRGGFLSKEAKSA